ncbi:hypothetical protein CDAR_69911 [Caerostris darwini]|uniref:Ribosomal protein L5 n=1 Tax=Caerostris darwini TaxID=1538125 RepID=A0AAV4T346_9ARAC|nr:hypothetical protein CDAR_69911 [Caerostris darwini]
MSKNSSKIYLRLNQRIEVQNVKLRKWPGRSEELEEMFPFETFSGLPYIQSLISFRSRNAFPFRYRKQNRSQNEETLITFETQPASSITELSFSLLGSGMQDKWRITISAFPLGLETCPIATKNHAHLISPAGAQIKQENFPSKPFRGSLISDRFDAETPFRFGIESNIDPRTSETLITFETHPAF